MNAISRIICVVCSTAAMMSCEPQPGDPVQRLPSSARQPALAFDEAFPLDEELTLEERDDALVVEPVVNLESDNELWIAEPREQQIRRYDLDGQVRSVFGRRGRGPGEFLSPMSVHRNSAGEIIVSDIGQGRITWIDPTGDSLLMVQQVPVIPLYDAAPWGRDTLLLLGTHPDDPQKRLLHLWDVRAETVVRSSFPLPGGSVIHRFASPLGWSDMDRRGESLALVHALVDSLYILGPDFEVDRRLSIPASYLTPIALPDRSVSDPLERSRWIDTLTRIFNVFWLSDERLVIQTARSEGRENVWSLVVMTDGGDLIGEYRDTPRLLEVDEEGRLLFQSAEAGALPNEWIWRTYE